MDTSRENPRHHVVLQMSDVRFGPESVFKSKEQLLEKITADIALYPTEGIPRPTILAFTGNLVQETGADRYSETLWFIHKLARYLSIKDEQVRNRIIVVPGPRDIRLGLNKRYLQDQSSDFVQFCLQLYTPKTTLPANRNVREGVYNITPGHSLKMEIFQNLLKYFDQDELSTLCFELDIDYDLLEGKSKASKARELAAFCERHDRTAQLMDAISKERPHVAWSTYTKDLPTQAALPAPPFYQGGHYSISVIEGDTSLIFLGFNSCSVSHSGSGEGYIPPDIAVEALQTAKGLPLGSKRVLIAAFSHNPTAQDNSSRLVNFYTELKEIFAHEGIALCLHGHAQSHHIEKYQLGEYGKSITTIAVGSLGALSRQQASRSEIPIPIQYNIVHLDLEMGTSTLFTRQYRPELPSTSKGDPTYGRWQEYKAFRSLNSESSKYYFSLQDKIHIAPAAIHFGANDRKTINQWGTQINRLVAQMKPTERMTEAVGLEIESALAIDDSLLFVRSSLETGWRPEQIELVFKPPIQLPPDLHEIAQRHRAKLSFPNRTKYSIQAIIPPIADKTLGEPTVRIQLAPISYFEIHGLELGLDDRLEDSTKKGNSLRERYFKDHALFTGDNRLPNKAVTHILVVTRDSKVILMKRSRYVEFQNAHWSVTFEEQMQGDHIDEISGTKTYGDEDFFAAATRGIKEELGLNVDRRAVTILGICSEYENLAYNIIGLAKLDFDSEEVLSAWKLHALDNAEHSQVLAVPFQPAYIFQLIQRDRVYIPEYSVHGDLWHPTSRMRILLGSLYYFGGKSIA